MFGIDIFDNFKKEDIEILEQISKLIENTI